MVRSLIRLLHRQPVEFVHERIVAQHRTILSTRQSDFNVHVRRPTYLDRQRQAIAIHRSDDTYVH
jgi:hypothetical protein